MAAARRASSLRFLRVSLPAMVVGVVVVLFIFVSYCNYIFYIVTVLFFAKKKMWLFSLVGGGGGGAGGAAGFINCLVLGKGRVVVS